MTSNKDNGKMKYKLYTKFIVVILITIMLIPISSADLTNFKILGSEDFGADTLTYNDNDFFQTNELSRSELIGYVFPSDIKNLKGLSLDNNKNRIEDFIELNEQLYVDYKYIDAIITLTQPPSEQLIKSLESLGVLVDQSFTIIDAVGASIPVTRLAEIGRLPTVELINSIQKVEPHLNSAVPLVKASQDKLKAEGYNGITGEGVTIAVIDSGIDGDHSTFSNRVIAFKDFVHGNDDLDPTNGMDAVDYGLGGIYHGTMVASCAAGSGSYKGVAIGANLIAVCVDTSYEMLQGIEWCINNRNKDFNKDGVSDGPDIISMSMGIAGSQSWFDNAAGNAMDYGVLFVTSAGNDGPGAYTVTSPATSSKVIGVGATDKYTKQIASFSSRGPGPGGIIKPDIVAPGVDLIVAYPNNNWVPWGRGTSFSCPIVAGIAALILQYDPELNPYEVKKILLDSAEDRGDEGPDNTYGYGFANAIDALNLVLKVKSITASSTKVIEDTTVVFSAVASGTNVKKFQWDFDDDEIFDLETTEGSASYKFTKSGTHTVRVKVTNQQDKTAESSIDIIVTNRKPDAKLSIDSISETYYEDQDIKFNASRSWDTDSDIKDLEYSWSFNNGLNFSNFTTEDKIIVHSFNTTGDHTIIVQVRDDDYSIDEASIGIIIENMVPIANAGNDIMAIEDQLIHFSGSGTIDTKSDLSTLNYTWNFGDDSKGFGQNTTHHYRVEKNNETFYVTLTVKDNDYKESQDKIKVIVLNRKPDVFAGKDKYGNEDDIIIFNGSGNDTINDVPFLVYKWMFGDGTSTDWTDIPNTSHVYSQMGTYHPVLLVKDPKGSINSQEINITIYNVKPKAKFTMSVDEAEEDRIIEFDATETTDSISDIKELKYMWDFGDGVIEFGKKVKHRYYESNRFTVKLTVIDDDESMSSFERKVTITNRMPTASILLKKKEFKTDELVRIYGYLSSDTRSDYKNLTYVWDFGDEDGSKVTGINATYKYSKPGTYSIKLKVEDDNFESDLDRITITVKEPIKKEDIFANPTWQNNGALIYTGIAVVIIVLILILISLFFYYRNKRGIFGYIERSIEKRKRMRSERESQYSSEDRVPEIGPSGLTIQQERFYQDLYGIHPQDFQRMYLSGARTNQIQGPQVPQPPNQFGQIPQKDGDDLKSPSELQNKLTTSSGTKNSDMISSSAKPPQLPPASGSQQKSNNVRINPNLETEL